MGAKESTPKPPNTEITLSFKTAILDIPKEIYDNITLPNNNPSYYYKYEVELYNDNKENSRTNTILFEGISSELIKKSSSISLTITNITNEKNSRIFSSLDNYLVYSINKVKETEYKKDKLAGQTGYKQGNCKENYDLFLNRFLPKTPITINTQKNGNYLSFYSTYGTRYYFNFKNEPSPNDNEEINICIDADNCKYNYTLSTANIKAAIKNSDPQKTVITIPLSKK